MWVIKTSFRPATPAAASRWCATGVEDFSNGVLIRGVPSHSWGAMWPAVSTRRLLRLALQTGRFVRVLRPSLRVGSCRGPTRWGLELGPEPYPPAPLGFVDRGVRQKYG